MPRARDWLLVPFLAVVSAIGIGWGARSTYRAVRNWSPTATTCADFLAHRDDSEWVRLDGCDPRVEHMAIESYGPKTQSPSSVLTPSAIYIPLRAGTGGFDRIALLLRVDHGPILQLGTRFASDAEISAARDALSEPIEGLVERSLDRSARSRDELRALGLNLADDFLIIEYGARPRPLWLAVGFLGLGLGAFALLVRKWRRRRRPPALARARMLAG